jgi:perosamine synthetase
MFGSSPQPRAMQAPSDGMFYFWSGRVALYALLRALQITRSDEIIVPVYTCPAVIEPVVGLGARVVYCDIERETLGLNSEEAMAAMTDRTKAVIVQHTFGVHSRVNKLVKFARGRQIAVLEDCCHVSTGYYGNPSGRLGDAAFYSHGLGKPLSVGGGGVAVVNAPPLIEAVARIYSQFSAVGYRQETRAAVRSMVIFARRWVDAMTPDLAATVLSRRQNGPAMAGMPSADYQLGPEYQRRMPLLYLRRLRRVLKEPSPYVSARQMAIKQYESGFRKLGIEVFRNSEARNATLWRYPIFALDKDELLKQARRRGVKLSDWGTLPLRSLAAAASKDRFGGPKFPVADDVGRRLVTLHIEEKLDGKEIDKTLDFLKDMRSRRVL